MGVFDRLPLDASGALTVSAPFCGEFFEAPLLLPFLSEAVLDRGHAAALSVFGCDVAAAPRWWPAWQEWAAHEFAGRVSLRFQQQYLEREQPPQAGLILAVHPEAASGGPWEKILANVIRSRAPGGRCVFVTFYAPEAEAVVRACRGLGVQCEVGENPHYAGRPALANGTHHRHFVVVR